jgi:hypothetical protein
VPSRPREVAPATSDHPAVAVMLIPDERTPGGLETLCIRELAIQAHWIQPCVNTYLSCGSCTALTWPPEKRDKAIFHSMIAALWQRDPGRAMSKTLAVPCSRPLSFCPQLQLGNC